MVVPIFSEVYMKMLMSLSLNFLINELLCILLVFFYTCLADSPQLSLHLLPTVVISCAATILHLDQIKVMAYKP